MAQSVKCPTSAQVMISPFPTSSPVSGFVLTSQSLELALDSVSPILSAPPLLVLCPSLSLKNKYFLKKKRIQRVKFSIKQSLFIQANLCPFQRFKSTLS